MERDLAALDDARAATVRTGDAAEIARIDRELRYWTARRASAQLVPAPDHPQTVQFGVTVTIARGDGRRQTFRIVGEDEADPARGTLSHVSPLARALYGKTAGDSAEVGGGEVEILGVA
jgi:transcription elongation GreA/GreB family factor